MNIYLFYKMIWDKGQTSNNNIHGSRHRQLLWKPPDIVTLNSSRASSHNSHQSGQLYIAQFSLSISSLKSAQTLTELLGLKVNRQVLNWIDKLGSSSALADLLCPYLQLKLEQELLWSLPSILLDHCCLIWSFARTNELVIADSKLV